MEDVNGNGVWDEADTIAKVYDEGIRHDGQLHCHLGR
jgi:hypothetical protein